MFVAEKMVVADKCLCCGAVVLNKCIMCLKRNRNSSMDDAD